MAGLLDEIVNRAERGEAVAVCVLARTAGSTPRKAGAMMLVLENGQTLGTIGGGCVEAEVRGWGLRRMGACGLRKAGAGDGMPPPQAPNTQAPNTQASLLRFELNQDYGWDDGLICGGVMFVAVQVVRDVRDAEPWRAAARELAAGRTARTVLHVVDEAGREAEVVHEEHPTPTLVIAGGGHVGQALCAVAGPGGAGFDVTVVDDRADVLTAARFPGATRVAGPIDRELARLALGEHHYVVIVTRGHRHDGDALAAVVPSPARYVGLIGSRRKVLAIYRSLLEDGVSPEVLRRVHAPIGLNVGAVTPGEIAVSIAAQLVAVRRGCGTGRPDAMELPPRDIQRLAPLRDGI